MNWPFVFVFYGKNLQNGRLPIGPPSSMMFHESSLGAFRTGDSDGSEPNLRQPTQHAPTKVPNPIKPRHPSPPPPPPPPRRRLVHVSSSLLAAASRHAVAFHHAAEQVIREEDEARPHPKGRQGALPPRRHLLRFRPLLRLRRGRGAQTRCRRGRHPRRRHQRRAPPDRFAGEPGD